MTINYTQSGDVAAQLYNEARRNGESHEKAVADSWEAMQHAKSNQDKQETTNTQHKTNT